MKTYRFIPLLLTFLLLPTVVKAETPPEFATAWGNELGVLHNPDGVAVDTSGNIYVADISGHRVQKFTADGAPVAQWLIQASGDGEFIYPYGIAVDANGNLYVAQYSWTLYGDGSYYGYHTINFWSIQKYDSSGNFLFEWEVGEDAYWINYYHIAVDASGNVYVTNGSDTLIYKFDSNGNLLTQWAVNDYCGDIPGFFPGSITVNKNGNIYVAGGSCIQKFDSAGNYLLQWGSQGSGEGQFDYPEAIAADANGNVFVTDYYNYRIQKFTSDGQFIAQWGTSGSGEGEFNFASGIAVDVTGNVYIADSGNNRIQKFNSAGIFLTQWGNLSSEPGHFYKYMEVYDIINDASGNLYVADLGNNQIQKYDNNGNFLTQWGTQGSGDGQIQYPTRITVDTANNIIVLDSGNSRLQTFSSSGTYLSQLKLVNPSTGQFWVPDDIAIDASGNIYAADSFYGHILKYDNTGNFMILWGTYGSWRPTDIAIDKESNVYVFDIDNLRIQKFDSNGAYLTQWGGFGYEAGLFFSQIRLTTDADDNVYISDSGNHRIQKFNSAGTFLSEWGGAGSGEGQLLLPGAISVDTGGSVFVFDGENYRLQKFTYLAPSQPSGLTASAASTTGINLSWTDASNNETGFIVERCKGAGCSAFAVIATVTANATAYSDTGLTAGTSYTYRVGATNNGSKSAYSNTATTTTLTATPPSAPKTLTATMGSGNQVNLSWSDQSTNETGFKIERCTGSTCSNFSQIATVGVNIVTWTDTTVTSGSTYRYRVRAYNSYGNSAYSNIVSITVSGSTSSPTAPSNLTATAQSTTQIKLTWTDNASNETQFKFERCQGVTCSNFVQIKMVSANTTTTTDSNLRSKTTYRYRVRASNTGGNSAYSNTASATTK